MPYLVEAIVDCYYHFLRTRAASAGAVLRYVNAALAQRGTVMGTGF